jgi:hypothetical protein
MALLGLLVFLFCAAACALTLRRCAAALRAALLSATLVR